MFHIHVLWYDEICHFDLEYPPMKPCLEAAGAWQPASRPERDAAKLRLVGGRFATGMVGGQRGAGTTGTTSTEPAQKRTGKG